MHVARCIRKTRLFLKFITALLVVFIIRTTFISFKDNGRVAKNIYEKKNVGLFSNDYRTVNGLLQKANKNKAIVSSKKLFDSIYGQEVQVDSFDDAGLPQIMLREDKDRLTKDNTKKMSEIDFMKMLEEQKHGATKSPTNDNNIQVCVRFLNGTESCMFVNEYKRFRAREFVEDYANPFMKNNTKPTLQSYPDSILRPNPLIMIKDASRSINNVKIDEELRKEKAKRIRAGDTDIMKIPEVQRILSNVFEYMIPNIVHFIWFNCHRYLIHHYISMLSALRYQKPSLILFHTDCVPNGTYWAAFVEEAAEKLKIVKRTPPMSVWGQQVTRVEHQSDVARIHILLEVGGIYMDDDVVVLKSLDSLRDKEMVLGEENYDALANSIIMANKKSWFLRRWFEEYNNFNGSRWSDSSCFVPWSMWHLFPTTIYVVKEKMLRPNWEEVAYIYRELWDWRKSYTIHLYSRFMPVFDGRHERTLKELAVLNTTYGEISRHVIWGDSSFKDITDWILS
ncbi:unnamed protein product [Clavelina lepadiformis]|uniref:Alpha-1,4-N-acetylglucosaminyltransferase n=1 Tax=Clavelina lepadiformis TaxID=159417 RepID=A0ABP0F5Y6_CLALP